MNFKELASPAHIFANDSLLERHSMTGNLSDPSVESDVRNALNNSNSRLLAASLLDVCSECIQVASVNARS